MQRVIVGEIGRPHGVRGLVRLRAFTADPAAIASYGPLTDEAGTRRFAVTPLPDGIARIEGVSDRDQAARLTGVKLYADRDRLPPPEDPEEFFLCDLEGLAAHGEDGSVLGVVRAVEDHGAGPFLVVDGKAGELLLPFTKAVVPVVDVAAGRLTVVPPAEIVVAPQPGEDAA
ncbi:ribosome maturation factor RimM [Falsiroseomonas sp.]|uniref:ribosome maturation factor RimM n=1 Tax=Falsiroseomonas sp. TaxID=2870721 RepID=UPI003F6EA280